MGGGICGLGAAMLLARDGHDVTVLERDADPGPDSPHDAWENWTRKGVAQFRQPHNLMPGLRVLLESDLPDVQEALRLAGAAKSTSSTRCRRCSLTSRRDRSMTSSGPIRLDVPSPSGCLPAARNVSPV